MSIFWLCAGAALLVAGGYLWGRERGMRELGATVALTLMANGYKLHNLSLEACGAEEQAAALQELMPMLDGWEDE